LECGKGVHSRKASQAEQNKLKGEIGMPYRDANGHFISKAEYEALQTNNAAPVPSPVNEDNDDDPFDEANEPEEASEPTQPEPVDWGARARTTQATPTGTIFIETGRGATAEVPVGSPFQPTIERIAEEAHYGGYFRVFLNSQEVVEPTEAPATIEAGMRIALTPYDKVG
jgi:hypothetical protein